jgi:hypothetical protein
VNVGDSDDSSNVSLDQSVRVWDAESQTGQQLRKLQGKKLEPFGKPHTLLTVIY